MAPLLRSLGGDGFSLLSRVMSRLLACLDDTLLVVEEPPQSQ